MNKTNILVGFVVSILFSSVIAFSLPAFAQGPDSAPGKSQVIAVSGIVPGKNLQVHIWLVVPPGADKNQAATAALANHGARPFTAEEFSTTGLVWDQFFDANTQNNFVTQNYNPRNDPTGTGGITSLLNTHSSWNAVSTSSFTFAYGGETTRCPSLVQECRGAQTFDGNNDVAWLPLKSANTLGVTWSGTSIDEADMALNTKFQWTTSGGSGYDVETVLLHENGHVAGLGHTTDITAIMYPSYQQLNRNLQPDDINGISFLYPATTPTNDSPIVVISSPSNNGSFNSSSLIAFEGTANDFEDGNLTSDLQWSSSIDGVIGSGGSFSKILSDGEHIITATVTDEGGLTGSDSITITVDTPPVSGSTVVVDSITYATSGGKNNDKHLTVSVHVSDGSGDNVSGASVSIQLSNGSSTWTATGTTSFTGNVDFNLKNAPSGTYTTTITGVVASGLTWDGETPDNGFSK